MQINNLHLIGGDIITIEYNKQEITAVFKQPKRGVIQRPTPPETRMRRAKTYRHGLKQLAYTDGMVHRKGVTT